MADRKQSQIMREKTITDCQFKPILVLGLLFILAPSILGDDRSDKKADKRDKRPAETAPAKVEVNNFGKVTDFFYRGAQPKRDEYRRLASVGVKTIIDLRDDPKDFSRSAAEQSGLKYVNFPMSDHDYPPADTAEKFLKLVSNESLWPIYVHCAGGRHRTGVMTAVYRLTVEGWDIERAYREMKVYDFYTRWGHGEMKDFIYDYNRVLQEKRTALNGASPAATTDANGK